MQRLSDCTDRPHSPTVGVVPDLSVVVPVFESECCLEPLAARLAAALSRSGIDYELILVNDASRDDSWSTIERLSRQNSRIIGVDLRRNFGQDNAIITGIRFARGQYVAIMDDDLQHDPAELPRLFEAAQRGADVVFARFGAKQQAAWKNVGSWFNGKVAEWTLLKPPDTYISPYKVISHAVAAEIARHDSSEPYVDSLLFQVTSRIVEVDVPHHPRFAGRGHYTLGKSIGVWARQACSYSVRPLRIATCAGVCIAALGMAFAAAVLVYRVATPERFPPVALGWASLMITVLFLTGAQMTLIGVLGEYVGRTFLVVNRRPQSVIRTIVGGEGHSRDRQAEVVERIA